MPLRKGQLFTAVARLKNWTGVCGVVPTVLTQVNHSMKVMTEETFGPIMPVMPFSTVEKRSH
jgi:acyl-CoA reductase-like NAD-dependent aldehyde dehydrogenase